MIYLHILSLFIWPNIQLKRWNNGHRQEKKICNSLTDKELLSQYERNSYKNKSQSNRKIDIEYEYIIHRKMLIQLWTDVQFCG